MIFENRQEAGRRLATELAEYKDKQVVILALPRGGIPIGFEIAKILHAPLEVLVARKIGAPYNPEFGIGAIAEGNVRVLDEPTLKLLEISKKGLDEVTDKEKEELKRRVALYRNNKPLPILKDRVVILVDDGLATGVTARAAIRGIRKHKPRELIFASPVCAYDTAAEFKHLVDDVVCVTKPVDFSAVGSWYRSFEQVSDEEVVELLRRSKTRTRPVVGIHHAEPEANMHHSGSSRFNLTSKL